MAYLEDKNLEFLQYCSTEDLQVLVDYLTKDKDGELRVSEELTSTEAYKKYYPHSLPMMWKQIAEELQHYGGNTFANGLRGTGVPYREILTDVAKKQKVNFNSNNSVEQIEQYILQSIMEKAIEEMSEEELKKFLTEIDAGKTVGTKQAMTAGALAALRLGGFTTYKMAVIVANAVAKSLLGRGLTLAGNATLTRGLSVVLGPIGWIITGLWTLFDIASPAYRVTIPSVIQVAYMRLKLQEEALKKNDFSERVDNAPKKESDSSFELKSFREANEKNIQYFFEEVQKLRNKNQLQDALMLLEQKEAEFGFLPEFKLAKEQIIANIQRVKAKVFFDKIENLLDNGNCEEAVNLLNANTTNYSKYEEFSTLSQKADYKMTLIKAKKYFDSLEELLKKDDYESVIKSLNENKALYGMYSRFQKLQEESLSKRKTSSVNSFFDDLVFLLEQGKHKEVLRVLYQNEEKYQSFERFSEIEEKALKGIKEA
ncbi:DUF3944 domain-containing protein [Capnocytophaga leadbetteri]